MILSSGSLVHINPRVFTKVHLDRCTGRFKGKSAGRRRPSLPWRRAQPEPVRAKLYTREPDCPPVSPFNYYVNWFVPLIRELKFNSSYPSRGRNTLVILVKGGHGGTSSYWVAALPGADAPATMVRSVRPAVEAVAARSRATKIPVCAVSTLPKLPRTSSSFSTTSERASSERPYRLRRAP